MITFLIRSFEQRNIYRHSRYVSTWRRSFCDGLQVLPVYFRGQTMTHFFRPALTQDHSKSLIVCFNGSRRAALDWVPFIEQIPGHSFLLIDPPGSGLNDEMPGVCLNAFENALMSLVSVSVRECLKAGKLPSATPVHVVGFSLGCALAARFAAEERAKSLTLLAPFTNIRAIAYQKGSRLSMLMGMTGILRTDQWLRKFAKQNQTPTGPDVVFVHGTEDNIVPHQMSETLLNLIRGKGEKPLPALFSLPGQNHNLLQCPITVKILKDRFDRS